MIHMQSVIADGDIELRLHDNLTWTGKPRVWVDYANMFFSTATPSDGEPFQFLAQTLTDRLKELNARREEIFSFPQVRDDSIAF